MKLDRWQWTVVATLFVLGLVCRLAVFSVPHDEGDELIYSALVDQLRAGAGYTLQGHPILDEPWIAGAQYDTPLFYHPPGGPLLFLVLGLPGAQLFSYALFFFAILVLGLSVAERSSRAYICFLAGLSAFTPIMTHVVSRYWLDGPLLAFSTAAAACFLLGVRRNKAGWVVAAGLLLGYASLIKLTALAIVPGVVLLAYVVDCRGLLRKAVLFIGVAALTQLPWELWQWSVTGSPFPTWAGKPSAELLALNEYVRAVTTERSAWIYFTVLPRVAWTCVPALLLLAYSWRDRALRFKGLALLFWAVLILGAHVWLGLQGYSKLLRYAVLVTPATVLLFSLLAAERWEAMREDGRIGLPEAAMLVGLAGFGMELLQGLKTPLLDDLDLIVPIL
jgi:4-amino-4-deoxy-L-arabinose transferase-like glycosyltransferase